jgi:hypothetical protein
MSPKQQLLDVASDPSNLNSTALILSGYDPSHPYSPQQSPKCELRASWPANHRDIYFGADGCLYDSESQKILNQCCATPDINNTGPIVNPYFYDQPIPDIYAKGWI